jgi:hypothetical protein
MTTTAETVAQRYDYISKWDFLMAVKAIEGRLDIKAVLLVWNKYYAD